MINNNFQQHVHGYVDWTTGIVIVYSYGHVDVFVKLDVASNCNNRPTNVERRTVSTSVATCCAFFYYNIVYPYHQCLDDMGRQQGKQHKALFILACTRSTLCCGSRYSIEVLILWHTCSIKHVVVNISCVQKGSKHKVLFILAGTRSTLCYGSQYSTEVLILWHPCSRKAIIVATAICFMRLTDSG